MHVDVALLVTYIVMAGVAAAVAAVPLLIALRFLAYSRRRAQALEKLASDAPPLPPPVQLR